MAHAIPTKLCQQQQGWKGSTSMASPFLCVIPHYKRYRRWGFLSWKMMWNLNDMSTFRRLPPWVVPQMFFFFFLNASVAIDILKIPWKSMGVGCWMLDVLFVWVVNCRSCQWRIHGQMWSGTQRSHSKRVAARSLFGFQASNGFFSDIYIWKRMYPCVFMCEICIDISSTKTRYWGLEFDNSWTCKPGELLVAALVVWWSIWKWLSFGVTR